MRELNDITLAGYRVDKGEGGWLAVSMSREQAAGRRNFIRGLLKHKAKWSRLTNDQLDRVRVFQMGGVWVIEDEELYQYVL
ncbi:MAG: hypothetical protein Q4F29_14525 [Lachnospiraceae bacterium]|nr:hypothetical protein [Lachnospiraceae bacterium]